MNKSKSNQLMKEGLTTLKYTLVSRHPCGDHVVEQKQWRNIRFSFIPSFHQTLVLSFDGKSFFKGTVSRDGFGFWWHAWSAQGLNRGRGQFLNLLGAPNDFMILLRKNVFLAVNGSSCWHNNVRGMYLVQVSLFFISQQGLGYFFRYWPLLPMHLLEDCANFTQTPEENANTAPQLFSTCD